MIVQGIQGSDAGLGWVGFALARNADGVRILQVDGGDGCVAPSDETVADGSYPISRPLFIYVNKQSAEQNAALTAWVDRYLSDEGIAPVGEVGYVGALRAGPRRHPLGVGKPGRPAPGDPRRPVVDCEQPPDPEAGRQQGKDQACDEVEPPEDSQHALQHHLEQHGDRERRREGLRDDLRRTAPRG
ncbi:MAG: hypothetical protein M5U19_17985 [Microthrixaceae bacterium]|nr:hypothetical protein [Microthrixaceae bacterium]